MLDDYCIIDVYNQPMLNEFQNLVLCNLNTFDLVDLVHTTRGDFLARWQQFVGRNN